jgi:hypothetical protein
MALNGRTRPLRVRPLSFQGDFHRFQFGGFNLRREDRLNRSDHLRDSVARGAGSAIEYVPATNARPVSLAFR